MKIFILLFIVSTLNFTRASIFETISKDPNLSKFMEYYNSFSKDYTTAEFLTVFVPNNEAFNLNSGKVNQEIYQTHLFQGSYIGMVDNWSKLPTTNFKYSNTMWITSVNTKNLFLKTGQDNYINQAKVISADQVVNRQCYHVIDRVLTAQPNADTETILQNVNTYTDVKYSKSSAIFLKLFEFVAKQGVGDYGLTKAELTGSIFTWFIPVDDAWQNISTSDYNNILSNFTILKEVVNNYFVFNELVFLRTDDFSFKMGKVQTETKYTWRDNKGYITLNSYVGEIIKSNIVVKFGVIHFISKPLISFETVQSRLETVAKKLMEELNKVVGNTSQLFTKNASVVILSDENLEAIKKLSDEEKREVLLSLFVIGLNDTSPSGKYMTMATNSSVVYYRHVNDQNKYLEYPDNTPTRVGPVLKITGSAKLVGGSVFTVQGNLGAVVSSCEQRLTELDRSSFSRALSRLPIKLELGSPYVLFAPSNMALSSLLSYTNTTTSTTLLTTTLYPSNISTSTLATQSTTISASTQRDKLIQFILQRLIFPLDQNFDLWRSYPENNRISIPTMNYAAINERIEILRETSGATVTYKTKSYVIKANQLGYRCYGSDKYKDDRSRDLTIYPIDFLLMENGDETKAETLCLVPPCAACFLRSNWLLTVATMAITIIIKQLISVH